MDIQWENKSENYRAIERLMADNAPLAGSLVVLPEMTCTGFSRNLITTAETQEQRQTADFYSKLAKQHQLTLVAGETLWNSDKKGRNLLSAWGPQGECLAQYQKIHPFSFSKEHEVFEGGRQLARFDWAGIMVAPYICYDLRFPEIFRMQAGAELIVVIANWPAARDFHWRSLLVARAIENQAYVVGVNRCGKDPNVSYAGSSLILDPQGEILAHAGERERMIRASLDIEELRAYRQRFPALQDRLGLQMPDLK